MDFDNREAGDFVKGETWVSGRPNCAGLFHVRIGSVGLIARLIKRHVTVIDLKAID